MINTENYYRRCERSPFFAIGIAVVTFSLCYCLEALDFFVGGLPIIVFLMLCAKSIYSPPKDPVYGLIIQVIILNTIVSFVALYYDSGGKSQNYYYLYVPFGFLCSVLFVFFKKKFREQLIKKEALPMPKNKMIRNYLVVLITVSMLILLPLYFSIYHSSCDLSKSRCSAGHFLLGDPHYIFSRMYLTMLALSLMGPAVLLPIIRIFYNRLRFNT